MSIKARLVILFFAFSILPALFIGLLMFENFREYFERSTVRGLDMIAALNRAELLELLNAKKERASGFATDDRIRQGLVRLNALEGGAREAESRRLGEYLRDVKLPTDPEIADSRMLDARGVVVASTDPALFGVDERDAAAFRLGMTSAVVLEAEVIIKGGRPVHLMPVAAPVMAGGRAAGVIVNSYSVGLLNELITGQRLRRLGAGQGIGIEEQGGLEVMLVSGEGLLLAGTGAYARLVPLERRLDTLPVAECLRAGAGFNGSWLNDAGVRVWGASDCFRVPSGPKWAVVVEQDEARALAPLRGMNYVVMLVVVVVAVVAGLISYATALSITRPIEELKRGARMLATGDLGHRIGSVEHDELGALARSFDSMADDLMRVTASRDELSREKAERMRAIDALRLSETKYRNLVDSSLAGIFRSDFAGRILFANSALATIFGFETPEEMMSEGIISRYRDPSRRDELVRLLRESGRVDGFEVDAVTRTGEPRVVLLSATVLKGVISGTVLDITERRRAEEVGREAKRSRALADITDALSNVVTDYQGVLDTIVRYVGDLVGGACVIRLLSGDGAIFDPVAVYHPEAGELMKEFIRANPQNTRQGAGGRLMSSGRQLMFGSPDEIWGNIRPEQRPVMERLGIRSALVTPLRSEGRVIGLMSCFRPEYGESFAAAERLLVQDLADRAALAISIARLFREARAYSAELERSNVELQQFAYVASHDLKEPLRMIDGYLKLLDRKYSDRLDDAARRHIGFAVSSAARMQHIIEDLLEYSRVSTQTRPFQPTDIGEVLDGVLKALEVSVREAGASVEGEGLPSVMADPVQISLLLQNLVANAIKFRDASRPPQVRVKAALEGEEWLFSVSDNGIGMDPAHMEKAFDMFQRLHGAEYPGTGIGLAICKRVVERHGGRIWVESAPGQGSTFYFTIPRRGGRRHGGPVNEAA